MPIDPYEFDPTDEPTESWRPEPPSIPEPWTAADELQLTKLNNAASHVREKFTDQEIGPDTAQNLMGQINGARGSFLQRQQAAKQMAQNEQQQQILSANATAKSIQLQNLQADARALPGQIVTDVDPETGKITRFAPKGQFEALEKRETEPPSGSSLGAGTRPKEWDQTPAPPSGSEMGAGPRPPAWDAQAEKPPTLTPQSDGTHTMTIWNGDKRSETTFAPDPSSPSGMRATGTQHYDEAGQLIQPGQPHDADPNQLTQADDRKLWQDSAQALGFDLRRPLTPQQQTSMRAVYNRKATELRASRVMQAREQEQQRAEQRQDEQKTQDKFDVELRDERRALQRELDRWRANPLNANKALPKHLEDIDDSAEKKVGDRWKRQGKTPPRGFGATGQKSTESKDSVAKGAADQQKAFDELMGALSAPRVTPKPPPKPQPLPKVEKAWQ